MTVIRSLPFFFLLVAVNNNFNVQGASCEKSAVGKTNCKPCGAGTRCNSCDWCTGYCYNGQTETSRDIDGGIEYGSVEAPYNIPFLEMFNDIDALLKVDGIADRYVVDLYREASVVTKEDCLICNNSPELNNLSSFTERASEELKILVGSLQFKPKAIEKTAETINILNNLPDSLKIKVEPTSNILKSIQKTSMSNTSESLKMNGESGEFILKLGCQPDSYNIIQLTQGRSTDRFKVYLGMSQKGPWEEVIDETLDDKKNRMNPLPLKAFSFESGIGRFVRFEAINCFDSITARYVKFEAFSWSGAGGEIQYFNEKQL